MSSFGTVLRAFREMTRDPDRYNRSLSQAGLGEQMGHIMEDRGFSGASVSNWERGINKISAEDRKVLVTLVKVLHMYDGIKTPEDANKLLESGNYRALNKEEAHGIFGETTQVTSVEGTVGNEDSPRSLNSFLIAKLFLVADAEYRALIAQAENGPPPSWPRVLAILMRKTSDRISFTPKTILWIGLWWLAWWLIGSSLRWPFASRAAALQAIGMYVVSTLIVPLLLGVLIDTKHSDYWKQQGMVSSKLLRLYTYQGAGIGFNLGYFLVFPVVFASYHLQLGSSVWFEFAAVSLGLILGNMSARVIPHNLWLAYGRFHLADGAIFFVVALLGPLWGIFFLEFYSVLLEPFWGSLVILVALLLAIMIPVGRSKKEIDPEQAQP